MADKTLLDAVSAGIENLGETTQESSDAVNDASTVAAAGDDGVGSGGTGTDAAGDAGGDADEVPGAEGAADGEGAEGEAGDTAGAKGGKGAEGAKDGTAAKADAAGAAAKVEGQPAKGALDPVKQRESAINDPIDQRLKESTRDRIQLLANEVKRQDGAIEQLNTLFDSVQSTGMSPEELAAMLGYAQARHQGTPEQKKQAYAFLKEELRAIALELGETDVVDFLGDHPDLQEAVTNNTITADYAKEVALSRSRAKRDTETAAASDQQTQVQREHIAGVQALNSAGAALVKRDGQAAFLAKKDMLVAVLKPVFARMHPSTWATTFQNAYDALPKPAAAAPIVTPPAKVVQQPLRPGTPAGGGGKKEPTNMKEAVFAAFDGAE